MPPPAWRPRAFGRRRDSPRSMKTSWAKPGPIWGPASAPRPPPTAPATNCARSPSPACSMRPSRSRHASSPVPALRRRSGSVNANSGPLPCGKPRRGPVHTPRAHSGRPSTPIIPTARPKPPRRCSASAPPACRLSMSATSCRAAPRSASSVRSTVRRPTPSCAGCWPVWTPAARQAVPVCRTSRRSRPWRRPCGATSASIPPRPRS